MRQPNSNLKSNRSNYKATLEATKCVSAICNKFKKKIIASEIERGEKKKQNENEF